MATASKSVRLLKRGVARIPDEDADVSYLEQPEFEDRLDEYRRGLFNFIGVRAWADVEVGGVRQRITSGGLWSIEDDSDADYLVDVEKEQAAELDDILRELGCPVE